MREKGVYVRYEGYSFVSGTRRGCDECPTFPRSRGVGQCNVSPAFLQMVYMSLLVLASLVFPLRLNRQETRRAALRIQHECTSKKTILQH